MVDIISGIQMIVGLALFFASGYLLSLIFFRKNEADAIERAVYSVTFSLTIPPLILFFINFLLRIPINTITVFVVYLLVCGASYFYHMQYGEGKHKS
ncbi:MAG TPA: hypothetical protein VJI13_05340 [Candidatus Norongarragalinales archaeon]|nr:hypothetical protein [Candidatus Norongarragalinales archaeon]